MEVNNKMLYGDYRLFTNYQSPKILNNEMKEKYNVVDIRKLKEVILINNLKEKKLLLQIHNNSISNGIIIY